MNTLRALASRAALLACAGCAVATDYDVVIRGGTVYDGSGRPPCRADVAIRGDRIAAIGELGAARGAREIDARGLAVAPGFVNVLSWATRSLFEDPRALSDVAQGVTLEIFGEGESMGPLSPAMKQHMQQTQDELRFDVPWTTLGEYLEHLEARGIGVNVASLVGATTLRIHEVGYADRAPTAEELERMCGLAREAMEQGALGVGSSLIYAPAFYAKTDELIALARAVAPYGGVYVSHLRSEGNALLEALDELITIAQEAGCPAEVYHLKAAGEQNWGKLERVIERIEQARREGLRITADMYTYTAGSTGLDAAMPPWVQAGGFGRWAVRLQDPEIRARVAAEMRTPTDAWENLYLAAGGGDGVLLVGFRNPELRGLTGKTLAAVARMRGKSVEETAMDLVVEDRSRVDCVYFLMSEQNVRRQITLPWVSFCSDSAAPAPAGVFLNSQPHPRAYGSFARLLGRYVRDEGLVPLEEAIRRLSALPCENFSIAQRGRLEPGFFADVVVFDPATIADRATYEQPHQLAVGVSDVLVNGTAVWRDGAPAVMPTESLPGRFVRGPGHRSRAGGADVAPRTGARPARREP